jgi:hypothetical protein
VISLAASSRAARSKRSSGNGCPERSNVQEWAYVALNRGRNANPLYLATSEPGHEECTQLTHRTQQAGPVFAPALFVRNAVQIAAIEQDQRKRSASPFIVESDPAASRA